MEVSVTVTRVDEDPQFLPSHEILRENLKKRKKTAKLFTEPRCGICGKILSDKHSLANHIQTHSTASPYQCRQCPYKGKTRKYLLRHMARMHRELSNPVICKYCGKKFRYKSKLAVHERVHTGEKPNKCDVCGKAFSSTYSLATHKLIHSDEKPFKCSFCDYACRDSSTLRKHEERHMGIKKHKCHLCDKCYDCKWRLSTHIKEIHTAPEARNHKCYKCDATFRNKWALLRHTALVHDRIKSCKCSVCGTHIPNSYNLSAHMRSHVDARPFVCTYNGCKATFKDKSTLKKHTVIHYPQQHLICDYCGKGFCRKNRLLRHILKMHDAPNTKSERCQYCGVSFLSKNYLSKHVREKHTSNRKYACDMCDFVTHNKPSIVMHIKHGHNHTNKIDCSICGKTYKRNSALKQHYKSSHNVKFKTKSRTEPKIQIKEEPLDLIPDLEIDLLDIEKEEPFADFEMEYTEDITKIYKPNSEKDQRLQELFKRMIHDPNYGLSDTNVVTTVQMETEPIKNLVKLDNASPSPVVLEDLGEQDLVLLVGDGQAKSEGDGLIESTNIIETETGGEELNKTEPETQPEEPSTNNQTEMETRTEDIVRKSPMPVEEFIQNVIGDVEVPSQNDETYTIDKESEEFVRQRVKEMIMNQRLVDKIRRKDYGRRTLKRFTEEELKNLKIVPRAKPVYKPKDAIINTEKKEKDRKVKKKERKTKRKRYKRKNDKSKTDGGKEGDSDTKKKDAKLIFNSFQCNVCYKLFETKPQLLEHCQIHFDLCNEFTLIKCPLCNFVAHKDIKKHFRTVHKEDISISFLEILDRKDNNSGSRYYYDTKNDKAKEMEIIPSVKILNKKAGMDIDKKNRENKNKRMSKVKLVKKGKEWIVQKEKFDLKGYVLPNAKELDKNDANYLNKVRKLGIEARSKGVKMLYPCNKCEKVCQNLSALTLHSRKHDPNKKPFAPKVWKHKIKDTDNGNTKDTQAENLDRIKNRTAKPKPIVNKHKCDPKLREFYENNIRGLNIEFWQFLKIYNKMDRDNVKDFKDLENSTDYGIGHVNYLERNQAGNINKETDNDQMKENNKDQRNSDKNNISNKKSVSVASGNKNKIANVKNKFTRTIRISRREHLKRLQLQKKLREKIANLGNV